MIRGILLSLLVPIVAVAQNGPTFEVASIRPAGLTGHYDVTLELAPEDYMPVMIRSAVNAGVVLPPQALRMLDGANADPFSNPLRNAGLTLESRKSPLEVIVVDAIAKTPTEN